MSKVIMEASHFWGDMWSSRIPGMTDTPEEEI